MGWRQPVDVGNVLPGLLEARITWKTPSHKKGLVSSSGGADSSLARNGELKTFQIALM